MKKITLLLLAGIASLTVSAQAFTEGKVVTKISYPDMEDNTGILAMLPKENVMYVKGDKARMEQPTGMGGKTVTVVDSKKKETNTFVDMMGTKYQIVQTEKDILESNKKMGDLAVTVTNETKTIAGYTCKKATIKTKDGEEELWFCPELKREGGNWASPYKGVEGMLMEYSITKESSMGPMVMKMTVTEITKEKVDDSKFKAPDGTWKKVTMDEFTKSMGK